MELRDYKYETTIITKRKMTMATLKLAAIRILLKEKFKVTKVKLLELNEGRVIVYSGIYEALQHEGNESATVELINLPYVREVFQDEPKGMTQEVIILYQRHYDEDDENALETDEI